MSGSLLAHAGERLRDRRAHGPAANTERPRDLLLREPEVVVRDDDRALAFGEEPEKLAHLEPAQDRGGRVARLQLRQPYLAPRTDEAASRLPEGDPVEPALEIAVVGRRMPQPLLERVMQTVERAIAIERRRDERAVHLRERTVIELLPPLSGDLGHSRSKAISRLVRLVASPYLTARDVADRHGPD